MESMTSLERSAEQNRPSQQGQLVFDFYDWVLLFELVYNGELEMCQSTIVICKVFRRFSTLQARDYTPGTFTACALHTKTKTDPS